ncbi:hypothetical protein TNCV_3887381 [Trichonephila clavipes]|nr:hypothetical protein TNCV_3887381 [Trichonephila clavipes]
MLLDRWIVRSVPLEIVVSSAHEGIHAWKTGSGRPGRPRGERIVRASTSVNPSDSFNYTSSWAIFSARQCSSAYSKSCSRLPTSFSDSSMADPLRRFVPCEHVWDQLNGICHRVTLYMI